nr:hypothetical protein [uncultured Albidiferax sp.]
MESFFSGGAFAIAGIAIVYLLFMFRKPQVPYDEQTPSQIMALRQHAKEHEDSAPQGIDRRAQDHDRRRS